MTDPFRLDGRRVLVTGAGSDIGRAVATVCGAAGAGLVITGRDPGRLAVTREALAAQMVPCEAVQADLVTEEGRRAVAATGPVDGVVHAAALAGPMLGRQVTSAHVHERIEINYVAPMLLTQRQLAAGAIRDGGSVLFVTSISAHVGTRGMSTYAGTKAALVAASRCLALELAPRRIRVNCISPAIVRTSVFALLGEAWLEEQAQRYPLGLGKPEDVANAALFLLCDASRWTTGQVLLMTGGCASA